MATATQPSTHTDREPGMSPEQADRIAELAEARGMSWADLAHASALAYGQAWWLALSRDDAADLIGVLEVDR